MGCRDVICRVQARNSTKRFVTQDACSLLESWPSSIRRSRTEGKRIDTLSRVWEPQTVGPLAHRILIRVGLGASQSVMNVPHRKGQVALTGHPAQSLEENT